MVFNKNWKILDEGNSGEVILLNIVTLKELRVEAPKEPTYFLFNLLHQEFTLDQVIDKFCQQYSQTERQWVMYYLNSLKKAGIVNCEVVPVNLSAQYLAGLDRQLRFFAELKNGRTKYENQCSIKNSRVAVLGLGSIAQWIILSLISSGVGSFKCIDFDTIEERNIGRQPIFRREDIGQLKCEVVSRFIVAHREGVKAQPINMMLTREADVEEVIRDCDIVLHCCDLPRFIIHRWINSACLSLEKPNLIVSSGRVGPFCIPHKTACYGCLETTIRERFALYDSLVGDITNSEVERFPELAVVAPLTGTLAAKEVIAHILGIKPQTHDAFLEINPFVLKIRSHKLPRNSQCYACGDIKYTKKEE